MGKVEEIFGGIQNSYFTVKMSDGVVATSYAAGDKFYIDPAKLLPLERFLPQPKGAVRGGRGTHHITPPPLIPTALCILTVETDELPTMTREGVAISHLLTHNFHALQRSQTVWCIMHVTE